MEGHEKRIVGLKSFMNQKCEQLLFFPVNTFSSTGQTPWMVNLQAILFLQSFGRALRNHRNESLHKVPCEFAYSRARFF